ncbi:hypothetical protein SNEBB_002379 [Seison nebaliae]|nr:hypothetical protein SNEBB_002379 [Seison nebaliae]
MSSSSATNNDSNTINSGDAPLIITSSQDISNVITAFNVDQIIDDYQSHNKNQNEIKLVRQSMNYPMAEYSDRIKRLVKYKSRPLKSDCLKKRRSMPHLLNDLTQRLSLGSIESFRNATNNETTLKKNDTCNKGRYSMFLGDELNIANNLITSKCLTTSLISNENSEHQPQRKSSLNVPFDHMAMRRNSSIFFIEGKNDDFIHFQILNGTQLLLENRVASLNGISLKSHCNDTIKQIDSTEEVNDYDFYLKGSNTALDLTMPSHYFAGRIIEGRC